MKQVERHGAKEKRKQDERGGMNEAQNRVGEKEDSIAHVLTFMKLHSNLLTEAACCLMW